MESEPLAENAKEAITEEDRVVEIENVDTKAESGDGDDDSNADEDDDNSNASETPLVIKTEEDEVPSEAFVGFSPPPSPGSSGPHQTAKELEYEIIRFNMKEEQPEYKSTNEEAPFIAYQDTKEDEIKKEKEVNPIVSSRIDDLRFSGGRRRRSSRGSSPSDSVSSRGSIRRSVSVSSRDSKGSLKSGARIRSAVRYNLPFENDWKREVVLKEIGADVSYIHPSGLKLKSLREVSENLTEGLTSEHFTFTPQPLNVAPEYEIVTKEAPSIRKSGRVITPSRNYKIVELREEKSRRRGSPGAPELAMAPPTKREKIVLKLNRASMKKPENESESKGDGKNFQLNELSSDESTPHHHPKAPRGPLRKITLGSTSEDGGSSHTPIKHRTNRKHGASRKMTDTWKRKISGDSWDSPKPPVEEPRRTCSIACTKAMGLIPTLQCCVCLCLYHPECADVARTSPTLQSQTYVCKNCRSKPEVRKPRLDVTITSPPAPPPPPPALTPPPPPPPQPMVHSAPQTVVTVNRRRFIMVPDLSTPPAVTPTSSRMVLQQPQPADLPSGNVENSPMLQPEGAAVKKQKQEESSGAPNLMHNICMGYNTLLRVFEFLTIQELVRAARVCRLWRDLARNESLWRTVRMKNSHVKDWKQFVSTLSQRGTRYLDLRKMLVPVSDDSCRYLPTVQCLENLHLGRVTPRALRSILQASFRLRECSAQLVKDGEGDEPFALNFSEGHKLEELRIQYLGGTPLSVSTVDFSPVSATIRKLSLLSLHGWSDANLSSLLQLTQLTELELGDCSTLPQNFPEILKSLIRLRRIRLEKPAEPCPVVETVRALKFLPDLKELELINVDVRAGFDVALGGLNQVKTLLLIPTYVSQSATTIALVLQGAYKLRATLHKLVWIFTEELLKITELYLDQRSDKPKRGGGNGVPILTPVPVPEVESGNAGLWANISERHNEDCGAVTVVPLEQLHDMLQVGLPNTNTHVLKLPFQNTGRQLLSDLK